MARIREFALRQNSEVCGYLYSDDAYFFYLAYNLEFNATRIQVEDSVAQYQNKGTLLRIV